MVIMMVMMTKKNRKIMMTKVTMVMMVTMMISNDDDGDNDGDDDDDAIQVRQYKTCKWYFKWHTAPCNVSSQYRFTGVLPPSSKHSQGQMFIVLNP